MTLRVALVGGPMYDGLYRMLQGVDVEVVVHADHPTLNRAVAERLQRGERIDVLSTHSKYAPSQTAWLRPLDDLLAPALVAALAPAAVERCRFEGRLWSVPRNIDVRVLWANRGLLGDRAVPDTWEALRAARLPFGFPGRESGLFGTFFEIVDGVMPFPGWEPFEGPDSDDLDEGTRDRMAAGAVAVPAGVAEGVVRLTDERRYEVPVVMVCPEYSADDARGWVEDGEIPELAKAANVSYVNIDSGHWPMFSKPVELAAVLDGLAS